MQLANEKRKTAQYENKLILLKRNLNSNLQAEATSKAAAFNNLLSWPLNSLRQLMEYLLLTIIHMRQHLFLQQMVNPFR